MPSPDLRSALHAQIDAMDEARLVIVERVLLALEAEKLHADINAGFDADRKMGLLTPKRVQAVVTQVRAERPDR